MKKIVFASFFVFSYLATHAQKDFQGMAVYESKTSTADFKSRFEGNKEITPEMQKMIEERMKKMFEKTFFLNFDKSASVYKEEEKTWCSGTRWRRNENDVVFYGRRRNLLQKRKRKNV